MTRSTLLILVLLVAVDSACFGLLLPVLPFLIGDLTGSFNAVSITQVTAVYAGCQFIAAPLLGRWADRIGRRPILIGSLAVGTVALLGSALAPTLATLILFQALKGASASVFAIAQAMVADRTEGMDQRTKAFGALGAALGLGFVFGPAVGGLVGAINPRAPFLLAALLCLVNLVLVITRIQESLAPRDHNQPVHPSRLRLWAAGMGDLRRLLTVYFLFYLGFSSFTGIFVIDARDRFGWGPQQAGLILCFVGVVAAGVQGGLLPQLLRRTRPGKLAGLGLVLVAVAILGVAAIEHGRQLYVTQLLFATGVGLSTPGLRGLLTSAVRPDQQGLLGGVTQACISLTELLGPLMAGRLYAYWGYGSTYQIQAGLVLVAAFLVISGRPLQVRTDANANAGTTAEAESPPVPEAAIHP